MQHSSPARANYHDSNNVRHGVSNHQYLDCLLSRLFRHSSKKTSQLRVTGLCGGNPPVTGGFPSQRASGAENVSIWWRQRVMRLLSSRCLLWHVSSLSDGTKPLLGTILAYHQSCTVAFASGQEIIRNRCPEIESSKLLPHLPEVNELTNQFGTKPMLEPTPPYR